MKNRICFLVWGFQPFPPHPGAPVRGTPSPEVTQALPSGEGYGRGRQYRLPVSGPWRGGIELLPPLITTSVSPAPKGLRHCLTCAKTPRPPQREQGLAA